MMLDILASTNEKTAAKVAGAAITDPSRLSGQKVLSAVLAANSARRAEDVVREDATKNTEHGLGPGAHKRLSN